MISNNTNNGTTINFYLNTVNSTTTEISSASTTYNGSRALGGTPLAPNERRIQAMLFFDYFVPMHGWTQYGMDGSMDVEIEGDMQINNQNISMMDIGPGLRTETRNFDNYGMYTYHHYGGNLGFRKIFSTWNDAARTTGGPSHVPARGVMTLDSLSANVYRGYGLVSAPITVTVPIGANPSMSFKSPTSLRVKFYSRPFGSTRLPARSAADLVQTIELNFPEADFPIPVLKHTGTVDMPGHSVPTTPENWWAFHLSGAISGKPGRLNYVSQRPGSTAGALVQPSDTLRTLVPYHGDTRLVAGSHFVPSGVFLPSTFYYDATRNDNLTDAISYADNGTNLTLAPPQIQSYLTGSSHTNYESYWAHYRPPVSDRLVSGASYNAKQFPKFPGIAVSNADRRSARPFQQWGDFDNGVAYLTDGPYINKPDEGNNARTGTPPTPYFGQSWQQVAGGATFFSPNRQVPSAGMFGSLPTRMRSGNVAYNAASPAANVNNTWRTLLLRPQSGHPGATNPPDHLWTDLFWMPVVEPYAISEPFSTAGKINMNYAIAPFNYITRKTGMAALLRAEKIPAIDTSVANSYKVSSNSTTTSTRLNLNIAETLKQWDAKFAGNELFVSSSQICDLHLVPQGQTVSGMSTFWSTRTITGDNSRERPYTNLLGRLTTKSNSFTVHFRVQVLKKSPATPANQWVEGRDIVASEYRGSTLIERYIDPNNTNIPDFATNTSANIDDFYRFRVIQTRRFAP